MDEEVQKLRQLVREEQRRREEEQRRREEEQRRREEAESQRDEEQRRRQEAESQRDEEQRRREVAEELATESLPLDLPQYLENCHSLDLAIRVVTNPTQTTQGDTTNPTGRIFPRRIIPWDDFPAKQEGIWDDLSNSTLFSSVATLPSRHQLQYIRSTLRPVSSEMGLRYFERDVVETAVEKLVESISVDAQLQSALGLPGTVTFESHMNLGRTTEDDAISGPMERMSLDEVGASSAAAGAMATAPASSSAAEPAPAPSAAEPPVAGPRTRRKARGKGNRAADQFCIYRTSGGQNVPALAIEYKAPHKLSVNDLVRGLESEIRPERDVINKDGEGFAFKARELAAAVVTQLFSYMVGMGIQYGYVCTGEAFVFLHIPDDPANVYFSLCVPSMDVMDDDETRLHRTAAAQVFAFVLQALRTGPPPESWHDEADRLDIWAVEYNDILRSIPETERKHNGPRDSPYKPQRWKGFRRSPIKTRSRCRQLDAHVGPREDDDDDGDDDDDDDDDDDNNDDDDDDDDDNDNDNSHSPTPRAGGKTASSTGTGSRGGRSRDQRQVQHHEPGPTTEEPSIHKRPFCTQRCLLGLARGWPLDENCPNSYHHGQQGRIDRLEFLRLVRHQLATDRGRDADCTPLHRSGARGSLFKVRLSTHGYTLVAKGVESIDRACLQHENDMYDRLRALQGKHVPVCLGSIDLLRPHHYDGGVYEHFLFLAWAGRPLFDSCDDDDDDDDDDKASRAQLVQGVTTIFKAIHGLRVLHRDAEPRNILRDDGGTLMVVDFERAEFCGGRRRRQPLGSTDANGRDRKRRTRGTWQKQGKEDEDEDDFARELESAVQSASRCIASPTPLPLRSLMWPRTGSLRGQVISSKIPLDTAARHEEESAK